MCSKQCLIHILIKEIIFNLDENSQEAVLLIHWTGGRHSEPRVQRWRSSGYPADLIPYVVDVLRRLAGQWPDRELATTLNGVRCRTSDVETCSTVRVREMREQLSLPECKAPPLIGEMISLMKAAQYLGISIGSAMTLALKGILSATQIMPSSPWMVSSSALATEEVQMGVRAVINRRLIFMRSINTKRRYHFQACSKELHTETSFASLQRKMKTSLENGSALRISTTWAGRPSNP